MSGGVFVLIGDDKLVELRERPYDSEDLLQQLLASHPDLLAGDQLGGEARRWLLVKREAGVPVETGGSSRWSLDHLFLDQDAVPTLVEVKRSDDTRIRREVVGQMLDYAANGVVYWPVERLRRDFDSECARVDQEPTTIFTAVFGEDRDIEEFWAAVEQNLRSGRVRLVFVADEIPEELRRVIEFLNQQMAPAEVIGVEVRQYVGDGDLKTLVPRVVGQTEQARAQKIPSNRGLDVDWDYYKGVLPETQYAIARKLYDELQGQIADRALPWTPAFRQGYFGFRRAGDYHVVGADLYRQSPIRLWIKLPAAPKVLQEKGLEVEDPYPQLSSHWDQQNKQWYWEVPKLDQLPDVGPALSLTSGFQPQLGPMQVP